MSSSSYADYIRHWGQLSDRIQVTPQLAAYEPLRLDLEAELEGLIDTTNEQAALKAQTQAITREIDGHVDRGRKLATRLRDAIRAQFGRDGEKLSEFGMNVRRPRTPVREPDTTEAQKPAETGPNPARTAAPETDGNAGS